MAAPTGRSYLRNILLAVRDRLVNKEVLGKDQIFLSMRMNPPYRRVQLPQYAIVLPLHQTAEQGWSDGAGRLFTVLRGRVDVYVRSSLALDEAYQDDLWLTDPSYGALTKLDQVIDALQLFFPEDAQGQPLLIEPMRLQFCNEPRKEYETGGEDGEVMAEFEIAYALNLDVSVDV